MKFKVSNLKVSKGNAKDTGKPWTLFNFKNAIDGLDYSAFAQAGYTDEFDNGYEFEAKTTEKPNPKGGVYRNVQWPKSERAQANNAQLDRIEAKIDQLLRGDSIVIPIKMGPNTSSTLPKDIPQMPYADSPHPGDEDAPF